MKITSISSQVKNTNRVNVSVDGSYRFSLDFYQLAELRIKVGDEYDEASLSEIETESEFGKLYARALEYVLMRPHSAREVRDYLRKKTFARKVKRRDGSVYDKEGISSTITERVFDRLQDKGYIDDRKFARFWVENRNQTKGSSLRKLRSELQAKGVSAEEISLVLDTSERNDDDELQKVLIKKQAKYPDQNKLMQYLARQGFSYDAIKSALQNNSIS